jgi:hypothetical protein
MIYGFEARPPFQVVDVSCAMFCCGPNARVSDIFWKASLILSALLALSGRLQSGAGVHMYVRSVQGAIARFAFLESSLQTLPPALPHDAPSTTNDALGSNSGVPAPQPPGPAPDTAAGANSAPPPARCAKTPLAQSRKFRACGKLGA